MSNQTFYIILFLGIGLIAGIVVLMKRSITSERKNRILSKKLFESENNNTALQNELAMYNRSL